jgi:hypothetical protein
LIGKYNQSLIFFHDPSTSLSSPSSVFFLLLSCPCLLSGNSPGTRKYRCPPTSHVGAYRRAGQKIRVDLEGQVEQSMTQNIKKTSKKKYDISRFTNALKSVF